MNRANRDRESGQRESHGSDPTFGNRRATNAEDAKSVLLAAVDRVIQLATNSSTTGSSSSQASTRPTGTDFSHSQVTLSQSRPCSVSRLSTSSRYQNERAGPSQQQDSMNNSSVSSAQEHRRLFGHASSVPQFEPSKSNYGLYQARSSARKGKFKKLSRGPGRPVKTTWKKECICLKHVHQTSRPSAEERMELARDGLGLAEVNFDHDGNASHIHKVLIETFPQLDQCGGYTLCRLSDNSHSLIEIEYPAKGLSVAYLKDILNQAKLYIRPLQSDIPSADSEVSIV